jgi:hypothetical protein
MPRKIPRAKTRRLWIAIKAKTNNAPPDVVRDTLVASINRGDYRYPSDWYVQIEWRNKEHAPMKVGEFTQEMTLSRQSSSGFDKSVLNYLRRK